MSDNNQQVIADFKQRGGRPGGYFENVPVLLLYTKGAKSGIERLSPLMYLRQNPDGAWHIFATDGGAPRNPAWFHNLVATPDAEIEIGDGTTIERIPVHARVLEGDEAAAIFAEQARRYPNFGTYAEKTTREIIPTVELTRR